VPNLELCRVPRGAKKNAGSSSLKKAIARYYLPTYLFTFKNRFIVAILIYDKIPNKSLAVQKWSLCEYHYILCLGCSGVVELYLRIKIAIFIA